MFPELSSTAPPPGLVGLLLLLLEHERAKATAITAAASTPNTHRLDMHASQKVKAAPAPGPRTAKPMTS
jgi:hypothetical protein